MFLFIDSFYLFNDNLPFLCRRHLGNFEKVDFFVLFKLTLPRKKNLRHYCRMSYNETCYGVKSFNITVVFTFYFSFFRLQKLQEIEN
jgi:hypothetical protein